ncbi:hypothetical protein GQ42DRAFT_154232 [Ramicandelaber brevisporus]|nr:hypothetical protein GQ42DRAFT_154232 [Ramicandelaber brevisporus]
MPHKELTIYVDIISSYSYILVERLAIFFEHQPEWKPSPDFSIKLVMVNLSSLFAKCGNSLLDSKGKNKLPHLFKDIMWMADCGGFPYAGPQRNKLDRDDNGKFVRPALECAMLQMLNDSGEPFHVVYNALRLFQRRLFGEGVSIRNTEQTVEVLSPAFDQETVVAWIAKAEENKEKLLAEIDVNTEKLFEMGGYGCPTLVPALDGQESDMFFFGSDRLEHIAHVFGFEYIPVGKFKSEGFKPLSP